MPPDKKPNRIRKNTPHKQSLKESELLFRRFVEQNLDGILLIDPHGILVEWNTNMEKLSGFSREEMLGLTVWETQIRLNKKDRSTTAQHKQFEEFYMNILQTGDLPEKMQSLETTLAKKDGAIIPVEQRAFVIKTSQGNWLGVIARDLTERKHAEATLFANDQRHRALYERTNDAVFIISPDGILLSVNQRAVEMLGYTESEMVGRLILDFIAPEERDNSLQKQAELLTGKPQPMYERMLIKKDGTRVPTEANVVVVYDSTGKPSHIQSLVRDITERKQSEQKIQQRLDELAMINAVGQVAASQLELNALIEMTGERMRQIPNVECLFIALLDDQTKMINFPYYRFYQDTIPAPPIPLGKGLTSRVIQNREVLLINQDIDQVSGKLGSILHHAPGKQHKPAKSWMGIPIKIGDRVIGVIGVQNFERTNAYDENDVRLWETLAANTGIAIQNAQLYDAAQREIAERKQAEAKIQQRLNELATVNAVSQVAALQLDLDTMIKLTGEKLRKIPNIHSLFIALYHAQTQIITTPYYRVYDDFVESMTVPHGQGLVSWIIKNRKRLVINHDMDRIRKELRSVRHHIPGKQYQPAKSWMGIPMQVRDQIIGVLGVQNFEREQAFSEDDVRLWETIAANIGVAIQNAQLYTIAQQELAERKKLIEELESRNTELTQFTYTVSHEMKNPLVTMKGFIGSINYDLKNNNFERAEKDLLRVANAVDKMSETVSDLLELSRVGRMLNETEDIPFAEIVHDALELTHGHLESHRITVKTQPNLPTIHGDRQRLIEVLHNLIDNAVKYMSNQAHPLIEIGQQGLEDNNFIFFIKDNGMGIAPEYQERIFGLFNKLDAKSEGTGIGLTFVKRILEFHGGRIWLDSELGRGSTFYFTLPRE